MSNGMVANMNPEEKLAFREKELAFERQLASERLSESVKLRKENASLNTQIALYKRVVDVARKVELWLRLHAISFRGYGYARLLGEVLANIDAIEERDDD